MRTHSNHLRLPTALPIRPRLRVLPFDKNGWLNQDGTAAPRSDHSPTAPPAVDETRFARVWKDHIPHTGRRPPQKGVANFRGFTTDANGREIVLESTLEQAAAAIAFADRKIARLQSQVGPVHHIDKDGKEKRPIFDFLATGVDGQSLAIAIKPGRKRISSGIDDTIAAIRKQRPDFGDEAKVWTEEQLPRCAEHNAGLILRSRKLRNDVDVSAMRELAKKTHGAFPLGHLLSVCRADARSFAAAVNLIDEGVLVAVEPGRIRPELKVRLREDLR